MIRVLQSVSNMDRGGIETMIMNYYRHMDRSLVQFDFLANKPKVGDYEPEIEAMGGRVYRAPGFNPLKFGGYVGYLRCVLAEDPAIRLIHVHNGALGFYALESARRCGMKERIYHAHSTQIPAGRGKPVKQLLKPLIRHVATRKLTCGVKSAEFYYGKGAVKRGECILIRNAIELDRFTFDPATRDRLRAAYGLTGHTVLGHIGRFSQVKNHDRLLDIFAAFRKMQPDALLVLLGEGELMDAVHAKAKRLGLGDDVRFIGNVSNANEWYQALDCFVMPSFYEGLPVVTVEAQTAALPCVLSAGIPQEAACTDLCRFIALDKSDEDWAALIAETIAQHPVRQDMTAIMREAGYDICQEAAKLQGLYLAWAQGAEEGGGK